MAPNKPQNSPVAVTVNRDMPLDKYRGFKDQFRVTLKPDGKEAAKAFVYEVDKKEVTATYNKGRALAEKAAIELTDRATVSNEDKALIKERR